MAVTKLVGSSVRRVEDPRFLRGKASYLDDIHLPGTLHVAFVRSTHAHARIKRIDVSAALCLPGVRRIFTGDEVAKALKPMGLPFREEVFPKSVFKQCIWPCMATGKVRCVGEPSVAVLADSRYLAEDGADLVDIEYDVLPAVVDPEAAMGPNATLIHEELGTNAIMRLSGGGSDV